MSAAVPATARRVATVFGIGTLPGAPGTWGSIAAIPLAWALHWAGGFWLLALGTVAVTAAGWWATHAWLAVTGPDDPAEIVVDEVSGMMLALWPLSAGLTLTGSEAWPWPGWLIAFLVFRFFDILKPFPVGWADRRPGALGVMLDDLVAGLLTALLSLLAAGIAHGWV